MIAPTFSHCYRHLPAVGNDDAASPHCVVLLGGMRFMSLQQVSNVSLSNNGLKGISYKHYALAIVAFSAIVRFLFP